MLLYCRPNQLLYFEINKVRNSGKYRKPRIHLSLEFYFSFKNCCDADNHPCVLGSPCCVKLRKWCHSICLFCVRRIFWYIFPNRFFTLVRCQIKEKIWFLFLVSFSRDRRLQRHKYHESWLCEYLFKKFLNHVLLINNMKRLCGLYCIMGKPNFWY